MDDVENSELKVFPVGFEHGVFKVISSYQVDVDFSVFDQVLERLYDLLDEHFGLLGYSRFAYELTLTDFHSLNLIFVIIIHDLTRVLNLLYKLLRNFIGNFIDGVVLIL